MLLSKQHFDQAISRVRQLDNLYLHLTATLHYPSSDVSDILRSEVVYAVSAFDKYIHDIVRKGMVEIYLGTRLVTNAYKKFEISLEQFELIRIATSFPPPEAVFESSVTERHRHLSFQDPEKVSSALSLIWNEPYKWQRIAGCIGMTENDTKIELKNIVIRRNQIVHEGDLNLLTGQLQSISHNDTIEAVNFIERLGTCISTLI